jgi:hypothetical protein
MSDGNLKLVGLVALSLLSTSTMSSSSVVSLSWPARSKSPCRSRKDFPEGKRGECIDCELVAKSFAGAVLGRS